ncbi:MAG: zinc dependent phospholipase C family protein [Treponema sp.]|jgi:hypothetical protein|nr:zinc dependent phospholipase C family protein [Treponema sp.]
MPAQILHTLFGEDVIAELPSTHPWRSLTRAYRTVFALGCQGPDIFYHSQKTRPVALEYGALLHRRGFGDFTAALFKKTLDIDLLGKIDKIAEKQFFPQGPLLAYTIGFMTHAALDRCAHPYIVYKSTMLAASEGFARMFPNGASHAFFERILDVLMLALLRGRSVATWDQGALAKVCAEPPRGLKELLMYTLIHAFPKRAGRDQQLSQRIDNAFQDCAYFYGLTDPRKTSRQYPPLEGALPLQDRWLCYLYPEHVPLSMDYLNLRQAPWYYPAQSHKEDSRSFPELYRAAVKTEGAAIGVRISRYLETGIVSEPEISRNIGNGGLSIQDETGRPCLPTWVGTLPLDLVLEQQRSWRWALHEARFPDI